jgi:hypothetical protein
MSTSDIPNTPEFPDTTERFATTADGESPRVSPTHPEPHAEQETTNSDLPGAPATVIEQMLRVLAQRHPWDVAGVGDAEGGFVLRDAAGAPIATVIPAERSGDPTARQLLALIARAPVMFDLLVRDYRMQSLARSGDLSAAEEMDATDWDDWTTNFLAKIEEIGDAVGVAVDEC